MHLEVEVGHRPLGVAGVPHEADHLSGLDARPIANARRERGQLRVVEEVALVVAQPETVAAGPVPADGEDRPPSHREQRLAERAEDVVAVVVVGFRAVGAVGVDG